FHEGRGRQGPGRRVDRIQIKPDTAGRMLGKDAFSITPGPRGGTVNRRIGIEDAPPIGIDRLSSFFPWQDAEEVVVEIRVEERQHLAESAVEFCPGAEKGRAQHDAGNAIWM